MKNYTATIKVTREYEIGFDSPDLKQANEDAKTIIEDEHFEGDFINEQKEIVEIKEDE